MSRPRTIKNRRAKKATLFSRDGRLCHWCRVELTMDTATLDHLIPWSKGGGNYNDNLVLACAPCNNKRGNSGEGRPRVPRHRLSKRDRKRFGSGGFSYFSGAGDTLLSFAESA